MDSPHQRPSEAIRAAEYVRVSTEHRDPTDHQRKVIGQYAERRGTIIVRTYTDAGKSGLKPCRPSLR
jgi:DNA invertase Pin-like site-specific DNA recombinase